MAESIVRQEVREFLSWLGNSDLVPTVAALSRKAERIRRKEVEKALSSMRAAVSEKQKTAVEAMSKAIVKKLLHQPISELKNAETQQSGAWLLEPLQKLFILDPYEEHSGEEPMPGGAAGSFQSIPRGNVSWLFCGI
jgi:glutamyl-tRNA reductase